MRNARDLFVFPKAVMALSPLTMSMSGTSMVHIETTMYNLTHA